MKDPMGEDWAPPSPTWSKDLIRKQQDEFATKSWGFDVDENDLVEVQALIKSAFKANIKIDPRLHRVADWMRWKLVNEKIPLPAPESTSPPDSEPIRQGVGDAVRTMRGVETQKQMAMKLGKTRAWLAQIELGSRAISVEHLASIAWAAGWALEINFVPDPDGTGIVPTLKEVRSLGRFEAELIAELARTLDVPLSEEDMKHILGLAQRFSTLKTSMPENYRGW